MFASHDRLGLHDILWGYAGLVASVFWWLRARYRPSSARVSLDGSVFVQQTSGSIRGGHAPHQYARHLRFLLTKYVSRGLVSYARQCVAGQSQGRVQQVFEACMSYHSSHAYYIMRKRQRESVYLLLFLPLTWAIILVALVAFGIESAPCSTDLWGNLCSWPLMAVIAQWERVPVDRWGRGWDHGTRSAIKQIAPGSVRCGKHIEFWYGYG